MRINTLRGATAAIVAGAFMSVLPAGAEAQPPDTWPCEESAFCIYREAKGGGAHYSLHDGADNLGQLAGGLDNHVWSVRNISGDDWCLYADPSFNTTLLVVLDGQAFDLESPIRDQVSSVNDCD